MLRFSTPPLSGKILTWGGSWDFGCAFFEGKKHRRSTVTSVMLNLFQHLIFVQPDNKEIPKRYKMSQRGTSCANLYAVAVRNDNRVCAFTLAEVLITLVIIGVIAALTIPNLMQKYTEQTTVKKVQKFYSNLANAYKLAMKDNGTVDEWELTTWDKESATQIYELLFKPYFKIAKNCGINNTGNCLANTTYKYLDNTDAANYSTAKYYYKILLDDGAIVWWVSTHSSSDNIIAVDYDVNGTKEPNQWGKDVFEFIIKKDKTFPNGFLASISSSEYSHCSFTFCCLSPSARFGSGGGCAAWVVYKGNMDYLHCDGLKWTSHSCKEK